MVALVVGVLQGTLEWLPISSEGSVALVLTVLASTDPTAAVQLSLFLHAGTGVAAAVYYRGDVRDLLATTVEGPTLDTSMNEEWWFLAAATVASGVVGIAVYVTLEDLLSEAATVAFVFLIGALLVGTGVLQRVATTRHGGRRTHPSLLDAVLVGVGQGLALLPGVSRSGTTTSVLLLRGYDEEIALRLSFLLAVPASLAAGVLSVIDGGLPAVTPGPAALALVASAVVGYATIGVLLAAVQRVAFWAVCICFGVLTLAGGVLML